jgi:hypothetical protein
VPQRRSRPNPAAQLVFVVVALAILLFVFVLPRLQHTQPQAQLQQPGALPEMSEKPRPILESFNGCPPEGDDPDESEQNRLKNRSDEGNWIPVTFDAVASLGWPKGAERRFRRHWSPADMGAIAHWEGIPISIEGYLAGTRLSGPESCNCHGRESDMRDYHMWLVKSAGDERGTSMVCEPTPRARARHPGWTVSALQQLAREQIRVRLSGWLFFDPEHPDQIGKTRGTLWEIHPVMKIEIQRGGEWIAME